MTICHQFTAFFFQPLLQLIPIFSSGVVVWGIREYPHHVHHGEIPLLLFRVPSGADLLILKELDLIVLLFIVHGMYLPG